ncbi:MAG: translesion error-prone DNA polymerase V autoproteolytic subunit [Microbacteriaceae bacterium]|nr:translesion error-prone DNA polymerase V autoproteolytic subunit [Microbacteriaceae bacterium]
MRVIAVSDLAEAGREILEKSKPIPVSPISVPAGFPSPAQDYYEHGVNLNEHLVLNPESTFILRVTGESMTGAGIWSGDEIIVDRSLRPKHGDVVVAVIDGELTVKRLIIDPKGVTLHAENPRYPDIRLRELSELSIWGVVTRCLHRV